VNILASDLNITPPGFGDLIYDEGGENPLNGKSVRFIADKLNEYMSSNDYLPASKDYSGKTQCHIPAGYEWLDSLKLWQTIRNIDTAFCGPIVINYWIPGSTNLSLTPVRSIADISYLHLDSNFVQTGRMHPVVASLLPDQFELLQNYPNPFNPTTTISFTLPQAGTVTLKIYNALGQEVATLLSNQEMEEGDQEIEFSATSFTSGVYFYRIGVDVKANDEDGVIEQHYSSVKKMILLK